MQDCKQPENRRPWQAATDCSLGPAAWGTKIGATDDVSPYELNRNPLWRRDGEEVPLKIEKLCTFETLGCLPKGSVVKAAQPNSIYCHSQPSLLLLTNRNFMTRSVGCLDSPDKTTIDTTTCGKIKKDLAGWYQL